MDFLIAIALLVICYFTGSQIEKTHYKNIQERELKYIHKPILNFSKKVIDKKRVIKTELVSASVVIGCDHFKAFLASLMNIFGGNISCYESVLDRGRREALLRMREIAHRQGATYITNVKLETVMLDPTGAQNPNVAITAYGTAVQYDS